METVDPNIVVGVIPKCPKILVSINFIFQPVSKTVIGTVFNFFIVEFMFESVMCGRG